MTQTSRLICPDCGAPRPERGAPCPACGSTDPTQVVEIGTAEEVNIALSMGLIAISRSPDEQTYRIQVQTHGGTRSDETIALPKASRLAPLKGR